MKPHRTSGAPARALDQQHVVPNEVDTLPPTMHRSPVWQVGHLLLHVKGRFMSLWTEENIKEDRDLVEFSVHSLLI